MVLGKNLSASIFAVSSSVISHSYQPTFIPSCTGSMWQIGLRSSSVWRCVSVFTVMRRTTCRSCVRRSPKLPNDSTFVRPAAAYSSCQEYSSTRTAVVRSPWLVRPSGTHSATTFVIQNSASPASVAYLRRICFSSTWCIERIKDTVL